ncbi:hypothetical protein F2Q70_00021793 [Brassica cretica]|uniref:Uncharacterized protein n=1 Tax=Brassica cretica TaxID=69181 RepID=A0A8S9GMG5_BRACR|nr:hypothetical protein F2Q70_00021793 [Brassica cretica]
MASKRRNNQRSCCFYIVDLWSLRMAMDRDTTKKSPRLKLIELGLFVADLDPEPALRPLDEVTTLVPRQFNWFLGPLEFLRRHLHNASFEKIFASRASCTKAGTHVLYSAQVNVKTSSEYYFARSCSMLRARQLILVKDGPLRHTRLWSLTNMPITRFRPSPRSTRCSVTRHCEHLIDKDKRKHNDDCRVMHQLRSPSPHLVSSHKLANVITKKPESDITDATQF